MAEAKSPTKRQQFWLRHLKRARSQGKSVAEYARTHELSAASLYHHRRLLAEIEASSAEPESAPAPAAPFVEVVRTQGDSAAVRVELPNGVAVSLDGALELESLLGALAKL